MTNLDRLISQYEDECARENWGDEMLVEVKVLIKNLTDVERAHGEIVEEYKAIDKKLAEVEPREVLLAKALRGLMFQLKQHDPGGCIEGREINGKNVDRLREAREALKK